MAPKAKFGCIPSSVFAECKVSSLVSEKKKVKNIEFSFHLLSGTEKNGETKESVLSSTLKILTLLKIPKYIPSDSVN